jgi:tRNA (guanine37-N1)-methyltransferase
MNFQFLTLFPEMFSVVLSSSLLGKAQEQGRVSFGFTQIRDHSTDKHRTADDTPYGGGEGLLIKVDVLYAAWRAAVDRFAALAPKAASSTELETSDILQPIETLSAGHISKSGLPDTQTILMSPQGKLLTQEGAKELAKCKNLIVVCGHYEGVDERFIDLCVDREISIGDYVLTGGEVPAMVLADVITRLLPGTVGNEDSVKNDSLEGGLLKYPQYTRPKEFRGLEVPAILMSGDHAKIEKWRMEQSIRRTREKRPDLDRSGRKRD